MTKRTVAWINFGTGFAIIAPGDGGKDAFVQIGAAERSGADGLRQGPPPGRELVADHEYGERRMLLN